MMKAVLSQRLVSLERFQKFESHVELYYVTFKFPDVPITNLKFENGQNLLRAGIVDHRRKCLLSNCVVINLNQ
jgi:hypothetical protein